MSGWKDAAAVLIGILALASLAALPAVYEQRHDERKDYGTLQYAILIDAGSSGSRVHVFSWDRNTRINQGNGIISQIGDTCVNTSSRGISEYTVAEDAALSLVSCLNAAQQLVPSTHRNGRTALFLAATAGMRMLRENNASHAAAILQSIDDLFKTYPFSGTAEIITGATEGLDGWVTVNYLQGLIDPILNPTPLPTVGALDLGGASTQITFVYDGDSPANTSEYFYNVSIYKQPYRTYSYSFLCLGLNEATRRYYGNLVKLNNYTSEMTDPCGLSGDLVNMTGDYLWVPPCSSGPEAVSAWGSVLEKPSVQQLFANGESGHGLLEQAEDAVFLLRGTGQDEECRALVDAMFPQTECPHPACSFDGVYQPGVDGRSFMAFAGYYHQAAPVGLTGSVVLEQLVNASSAVCNMTLEEVLQLPHLRAEFANRYCFSLKYASALLADGLQFPLNSTLQIIGDINGTDAGWALGYTISQSGLLSIDYGPAQIKTGLFVGALSAGAFILILVFAWVIARYRAKSRAEGAYAPLNRDDNKAYGSV